VSILSIISFIKETARRFPL